MSVKKLVEFRTLNGAHPDSPGRQGYPNSKACNVLFWSAQSGFLSLFSAAALARWGDGQFGVYAAGNTTSNRERQVIERFLRSHSRFGRMIAPAYQSSWNSGDGPEINIVILLDGDSTIPMPVTHTPPLFVDWGLPDPLRDELWPQDLDAKMKHVALVLERRVRLLSCTRISAYDHDAIMQRLDEIREFNPLQSRIVPAVARSRTRPRMQGLSVEP